MKKWNRAKGYFCLASMLGLESGGGALFVLESMKSLTSISKEYLCLADSILLRWERYLFFSLEGDFSMLGGQGKARYCSHTCAQQWDFADAAHSKSAKSAARTVSYGIFSSENSYLWTVTKAPVTVHACVPSNGICRGFAFKYGKFLLPPRFLTALSVPKVPTRE